MTELDPVVRMAGEMLTQFRHRPADEAAGAVAEHIRQFWDPRMRRKLRSASQDSEVDDDIRRVAELIG